MDPRKRLDIVDGVALFITLAILVGCVIAYLDYVKGIVLLFIQTFLGAVQIIGYGLVTCPRVSDCLASRSPSRERAGCSLSSHSWIKLASANGINSPRLAKRAFPFFTCSPSCG